MESRVPSPPTLPSAPVLAFAESGMNRAAPARRLRAASRQSGLACAGMTSGPDGGFGFFTFTLNDTDGGCDLCELYFLKEFVKGNNAPLCTELVEGGDELVFEMIVRVITRVWVVFALAIGEHDSAVLVV